jgi:predicted Zn finger-like uncharacterized protein
MIIECKKCHTKYNISSNKLGSFGKNVKCTRCNYVWFQQNDGKIEKPLIPDAIPNNSSLPVVIEHQAPLWLKSLPLMFFCLILLSYVFFFQETVIKIFPSSNKLYDTAGIPDANEINLEDISLTFKDNYVDINGFVKNKSNDKRLMPKILISTTDDNGKTTLTSIVEFHNRFLKPHEISAFHKRITNIPEHSHYLVVSIANKFDLILNRFD